MDLRRPLRLYTKRSARLRDGKGQPNKLREQEHRIYCLEGGYVAAGEGEDRVMLLRDQWLEINAPVNTSEMINRLANSVTPHERK